MEQPLLYQKESESLLKTCNEEECDVHLARGQRGTLTQTANFCPDNIKDDMIGEISLQFYSLQWGVLGGERHDRLSVASSVVSKGSSSAKCKCTKCVLADFSCLV